MAFDIAGARKAGYTPAEIADFLASQNKFDLAGARKAGYSDDEIIGEMTKAAAAPAAAPATDKRSLGERFVDNVKDGFNQSSPVAGIRDAYTQPASAILKMVAGPLFGGPMPLVNLVAPPPPPPVAHGGAHAPQNAVLGVVQDVIKNMPGILDTPLGAPVKAATAIKGMMDGPAARAQVVQGERTRRADYQAKAAADPIGKSGNPILSAAAMLGGQLVGGSVDPLNFAPGMAPEKAALSVAGNTLKNRAQTFARDAGEAALGNAVSDVTTQSSDLHSGVQDQYNPEQTAMAAAMGPAFHAAAGAVRAVFRTFVKAKTGVDPGPDVSPTPADIHDMGTDPHTAAALVQLGIDPSDPRWGDRAASYEAAQHRSTIKADAPSIIAKASEEVAQDGEVSAETAAQMAVLETAPNMHGEVAAPTRPNADGQPVFDPRRAAAALAQEQAGADPVSQLRASLQAATQPAVLAGESNPGHVNPAVIPVPERAPVPDVIPVDPQGRAVVDQSTAVGEQLRRPANLPVVVEPQPMSRAGIEESQALLRGERDTGARGKRPAPEGNTMLAPEGRAPQTGAQAAQDAEARQAFDLAERQRQRVAGDVRDTQTAGQPHGPEPMVVALDEGFPVRIVESGKGGAIKVERYDPRTGEKADGAEPYWTTRGMLDQRSYDPEPRRSQDFGARDNPQRMSPEQQRTANQPVRREPTQTYRATDNQVPNDGGPAFPNQAEGPSPFRDQPRGERAQRAQNEEELRQRYERAQQEGVDAEREAHARKDRAQSTNKPQAPDTDGRFEVDNNGYVKSDKGGPIVFGDQKMAAKWIIGEGHKKSPDQIFEVANHPTKRGTFTVVERGRSEASAGAGAPPHAEAAGGGESTPAADPKALPSPEAPNAEPVQEAPRAEAAEKDAPGGIANPVHQRMAERARMKGMPGHRLEADMARALEKEKAATTKVAREAARAEFRTLRAERDARERVDAETADHTPQREGEKPKDAKARTESDLDAMILRARELDAEGKGDTRLRYEMTTASGRKTTFVMPADPAKWEGLKDRLLNSPTNRSPATELSPPNERAATFKEPARWEEVGPDGKVTQREATVSIAKATPGRPAKVDRFAHETDVSRRDVLMGGAAGVAAAAAPTAARAEGKVHFEDSRIAKAALAGDVKGTLQALATDAESPVVRWVAERMVKAGGVGEKWTLRVTDLATDSDAERMSGANGLTLIPAHGKGEILIRRDPSQGFNEETLAHELIHAFVIARYRALSSYLGDNLKLVGLTKGKALDLTEELRGMWRDVSSAIEREFPEIRDGGGDYGIHHQEMWRSPDEFLSWGLTNPKAQAYLKGLTAQGEKHEITVWDKFVAWVGQLFGGDGHVPTMFSRLLETTDRFIATAAHDAPDMNVAHKLGEYDETHWRARDTLYSNPLDPKLIHAELLKPAGRAVKAALLATSRAVSPLIAAAKASPPAEWARAVKPYLDVIHHTNGEVMRLIAGRQTSAKAAAAIRQLADMVASDPGAGRKIGQTYQRAYQARTMAMANALMNLLGHDATHDFSVAVGDHLSGRKLAPAGSRERTVADRVRKLLDDQHDYLKAAGLEVGYVRGRYFPRILDLAKVEANVNGFKTKAADLYRSMGLNAKDAGEAAQDWLNRTRGLTDSVYTGGGPASNMTKGRVLPPGADKVLADFYVTDPRDALVSYFRSTSRAAEAARRFGVKAEKVQAIIDTLATEGVSAKDQQRVRAAFDSSTNHLFTGTRPNGYSDGLGWAQTVGVLTLLPRAVLASLPEALTIGVRAHSPIVGLRAFADSLQEMTALRSKDGMKERAEAMGIVGDALNEFIIASRMDGDQGSRNQQKLLVKFFKLTGLEDVTAAQRVTAVRFGHAFVSKLVQDVTEGHARAKSSERLLAELGMDVKDAHGVRAWLDANGGAAPLGDLTKHDGPAAAYRTAIQRFVDESIQNPTAADKPMLSNHPWGRMAYGITSFMFSFVKNVAARTGHELAESVKTGKGYTLHDRAQLAAPAVALAVLTAAQMGWSEVRDMITNPQAYGERTAGQQLMADLSRAGVFLNADPLVNIATAGRYSRDATSLITGPYMASQAKAVMDITGPMRPGNNAKTNNTEWNAAKAVYSSVAAPLLTAGIANVANVLPGGAMGKIAAGLLMQTASAPGTGRAFADATVGERDVKPKGRAGSAAKIIQD